MPKKPTPSEAPKKGAVKATPKKAEAPKAAAAKKQAPKKEAPKKETPKKVEAPKKAAQKQAPKKEAPKKAVQKQAPKKQAGAKGGKVVKKTQRRKPQFKVHDSVFEKKARIFGIGGHLPPKKDMTRYVRWPKYIRLQRQRRILYQRLKVPPSINQFARTFDKHTAFRIFKLAEKYKPESLKAKRQRLVAAAKARVKGATSAPPPRPLSVRAGINEVTSLVERKKAKLVVIAHDVDPIELVVWLPALCRKLKVPYCVVKSKSRLGTLVGRSTCACFCFTNVRNEDQEELNALTTVSKETYNDKFDENRKSWGGGILGLKARHALAKKKTIKIGK